MALERKKTCNVFKEAHDAWGSYDEFPVGPPGTDPMPCLSRNRVAQPFYLVCERDQVLIQMAGHGRVDFAEGDTASLALGPGDTVYLPAGLPSRLVPDGECVQLRLRAEPAGGEAAAFYCPGCGHLISAHQWQEGLAQEHYWQAVQAFNGDAARRVCPGCGAVHPPVDLGDIAWPAVAAALRAGA